MPADLPRFEEVCRELAREHLRPAQEACARAACLGWGELGGDLAQCGRSLAAVNASAGPFLSLSHVWYTMEAGGPSAPPPAR